MACFLKKTNRKTTFTCKFTFHSVTWIPRTPKINDISLLAICQNLSKTVWLIPLLISRSKWTSSILNSVLNVHRAK